MNRYRSYGERDDQPQVVGDGAFKGVDEYNAVENIAEGEVQQAVNMDFTSQDAVTRGGFVCLPAVSRLSNPLTRKLIQTTGSLPTYSRPYIILKDSGYYLAVSSSITSIPGGSTTYTSYAYQSYDLNTFTLVSTISNFYLRDAIFSEGKFFIVGYSSVAGSLSAYGASSIDGITWTAISGLPSGLTSLNLILQAFNTLVITAGDAFQYYSIKSVNGGTTWTSSTINFNLSSLLYYNGVFVGGYNNIVAGSPQTYISSIAYSYDAVNWYQSNIPIASSTTSGAIRSPNISFGNSVFLSIVFSSTYKAAYKSYDGINWEPSIEFSDYRQVLGFTFYNGYFLAFFGKEISELSNSQVCEIVSTISGDSLTSRYLYPPPTSQVLFDATNTITVYNFTIN